MILDVISNANLDYDFRLSIIHFVHLVFSPWVAGIDNKKTRTDTSSTLSKVSANTMQSYPSKSPRI